MEIPLKLNVKFKLSDGRIDTFKNHSGLVYKKWGISVNTKAVEARKEGISIVQVHT
jgi:hypothetical protein